MRSTQVRRRMNDNGKISYPPSGAWQTSTRRTSPTTWRPRAMTECSRCWTRCWTSLRRSLVRMTGWASGWEAASCVWRTSLSVRKSSCPEDVLFVQLRIGLYLYRLHQLGLDSVYYQGMLVSGKR